MTAGVSTSSDYIYASKFIICEDYHDEKTSNIINLYWSQSVFSAVKPMESRAFKTHVIITALLSIHLSCLDAAITGSSSRGSLTNLDTFYGVFGNRKLGWETLNSLQSSEKTLDVSQWHIHLQKGYFVFRADVSFSAKHEQRPQNSISDSFGSLNSTFDKSEVSGILPNDKLISLCANADLMWSFINCFLISYTLQSWINIHPRVLYMATNATSLCIALMM